MTDIITKLSIRFYTVAGENIFAFSIHVLLLSYAMFLFTTPTWNHFIFSAADNFSTVHWLQHMQAKVSAMQ